MYILCLCVVIIWSVPSDPFDFLTSFPKGYFTTWWRHHMETFSAPLAICAGNSSVTGEFPAQRPVTQSFDVFFDLQLNKRLNKQWWGWWFEPPSLSLWRHCNEQCHVIVPLKFHSEFWTHTAQIRHFTVLKKLSSYDILESWHLKSSWGPSRASIH